MSKYKWELNISTGNYIYNVTDLIRLIRLKGGELYIAEFWGDHSLKYPISGNVAKSPKMALESLKSLI